MELQTQEILSILPTKGNIETLANHLAYDVQQGNLNPVETVVKLSAVEQLCKTTRTKIEDAVVECLELNNGKIGYEGSKVEKCEVATKYDYSHDSRWNELKKAADAANEALKDHEEKLKKIPAGKLLVDNDTGESFVGPAKSSKTSFKITLSK